MLRCTLTVAALCVAAGSLVAEGPTPGPVAGGAGRPILLPGGGPIGLPGGDGVAQGAAGCGDLFGCPAPRPARFWVSGEYLRWWARSAPRPAPLAAVAPGDSTALVPGALGNPDTTVVLGGEAIDYPVFSGGRFVAGLWLDDERTLGVEGGYFFLGERTQQRRASSPGGGTAPFLVNPFAEGGAGGGEIANYLAFPAPFDSAGTAGLTSSLRLQGAEVNGLLALSNAPQARVSLLGGFRYLELREGLAFATTQQDLVGFAFPGQFVNTFDSFDTRNRFYGGQVGARVEAAWRRLFVQATGKVALGGTNEVVRVQGATTTNTAQGYVGPIPVTTVPGGIYALPTNIGERSSDRFAVVPEVTVQVGVELTRRVRAFVGYNFLYISDVARPGDQIDRTINSTQLVSFTGVPTGPLVGPARPAARFGHTDFWAQGINFGLALQW